jgi:predicted alpha/beta-hydrolase family hydrolase
MTTAVGGYPAYQPPPGAPARERSDHLAALTTLIAAEKDREKIGKASLWARYGAWGTAQCLC